MIHLMMKFFCSFLLLTAFHFSTAQTRIVKFDRVEKIINTPSDKIQVINFWATWCGPCVQELPLFETLQKEQANGVKVTLVSLDFADKVDKVNTFVSRKNIRSEVILLDDIDYNAWIDRVDSSWSGAIPATLLINTKTGHRKFVGKELKEGELEKLVAELQ
jgi:thiol-disulfide isomerase/thioredoxin